ncbi:hypothetical protein PUNSTDRAFT_95274 [Punctularia strigosozonata HHB-11173 SS5]|uniref:uncharacterized protein n=1 Tax=Punctularia strigosozonata (strain HHB-11173) TaxID=741275 RepID=UPI000441702B|nr:uncharacterized protein PUNSTDRAFT_95274 [Punctularia strigosozonata HHB-11173 SS5]EIN13875.1 hypothetical protein PUNSTDRAFT_95274 [Punctularia strigosozonata HHB-11173 SS5]
MQRVERLKITFLVDNSIEWMSKLPPGFSHEIKHHMTHDPPIDDLTGVPICDLENFCCGAHGFSALIETESRGQTHYTLFDTGPESKSLVRNLHALKVPIDRISTVILSHWHSDHSGGLLSFLQLRQQQGARGNVAVDLHPSRPIARGGAPPPNYDKVSWRLPADPTFEDIEKCGGTVHTNDQPHTVASGTVYVSGEIPRVTDFEEGLMGGMRFVADKSEGKWIREWDIMDERYAAIDVLGKGLVIFTACSHAGVVNVIRDAVMRLSRPVYMVVGGLHLAGPETHHRIPLTVDFLSRQLRPTPTYVLPMHCSGFAAKVALERELKDACVPASTGMTVDVEGDASFDGRLMEPVIQQ